jgi:riboflavin kinase/FMN adenylyltransferase
MRFKGLVKKHLGRGKKLGFPTANIEAPKDCEDGLYVGWAVQKPALIFIGANETFDEIERRAEVYILDFAGDLYDQEIEVEIIKKLRGVTKFDSAEDLIAQMREDERVARDFFANYNQNI